MKTLLLTLLILTIIITNLKAEKLEGQAKIDSLIAELEIAKEDTNKVNLYKSLSSEFSNIDPNKGLEYGNLGLALAKKINWNKGIAESYNSLGLNYESQSNYQKALEFYSNALQYYKKIKNNSGIATNLGNIGVVYAKQSYFSKALGYFFRVLKIYENLGNKSETAIYLGNIGNIYSEQSNYYKALEYHNKALKINEELGNLQGTALNLGNIGNIYYNQYNFTKALEYHSKALKINKELRNLQGTAINLINIGNIYFEQSNYYKALDYIEKSLNIFEKLGNKFGIGMTLGNIGELYSHLSQDSVIIKPTELNQYFSLNKSINLNKSIDYYLKAIILFKDIGELYYRSDYLKKLSYAYSQKGDYKKAYEALDEHKKFQDSVFNIDKEKEIANLTAVREKEVAEKELVISQLENDQRKKESYLLYGGLGLLAFVVLIIFRQRRQSEKLLLNILPAKIAKRLKKRKADIADDIGNASTVFIDLVGFTEYSKDKKASDVLKMLNQIFSRIDKLVLKHGLEKIKTIGDGYMAAAGVPEYQEDHTKRAADFALEVHKELEKFNSENGTDISARIGIESGPMVAGVIGDMKFIYDLWGDTVNTASRMESTGTPNKVHITENFKLELENHRNGFVFSEPVEMDIKGKDKMKTYYIESKVPTSL